MTSPVTAIMDQISTDWEAATPPDLATQTYRQVEDLELQMGYNRSFWWQPAVRDQVVSEAADNGAAQVQWILIAQLYLHMAGRGHRSMVDALANESNLLMRVVERRGAWPTDVVEVVTQRVDGFETLESGDVVVTLVFQVLVAERD